MLYSKPHVKISQTLLTDTLRSYIHKYHTVVVVIGIARTIVDGWSLTTSVD